MNNLFNNKLIEPSIQWMIRRDMPTVLAIDSACHEHPWTEEEFIRCLRQRNCIGMVARHGDEIVGFMVYLLETRTLDVINLAVAPEYQRRGVGRAMIERLKDKLSPERRSRLTMMVRESNLDAQLFCKAVGMRCTEIVRGAFGGCGEEERYMFQWRCKKGTGE